MATHGMNKMKITKRQLRRIIKEAVDLDLSVMPGEFVIHPKLGIGTVETYDIDDFGRLAMTVKLPAGKVVDARSGETDGRVWRKETFKDYSPLAVELASEAIQVVDYPQGAAIENEIHTLLDGMPNVGDDERWEVADEALSVAGIMLGVLDTWAGVLFAVLVAWAGILFAVRV